MGQREKELRLALPVLLINLKISISPVPKKKLCSLTTVRLTLSLHQEVKARSIQTSRLIFLCESGNEKRKYDKEGAKIEVYSQASNMGKPLRSICRRRARSLTGGNNLRSQPSSALALTQWAPLVVAAAALCLYLFLGLYARAGGERRQDSLCDTRAQSCNFTTNVKKNRRKGEKLAKERSGISIAARLSHLLLDFLATLEAAFACESADSARRRMSVPPTRCKNLYITVLLSNQRSFLPA